MSEYQYVAFRAIDGPVSGKNLKFMQEQSTRAEVTPWSFDNEYHYGDFHGKVSEMLRRGYDFHLHFADFGIRKLMIRLPKGLPAGAAKPYFSDDLLELKKDKQGPGRILCIEPYLEPDYVEQLSESDDLIERLLALRAEILDGDLRSLYLAHLAVACDDNHDPEETTEAPVPGGLDQLTDAQHALAEFYGLDATLIAAAAQSSPPLPGRDDSARAYAPWLQQQPEKTKNAWLAQLMSEPRSRVRSEMLSKFRGDQDNPAWPVLCSGRTVAELMAAAESIKREHNRKKAAAAARKRAKALAGMSANPERTLRESEQLVEQRTTAAYRQSAALLADLRQALAGREQSDLPEKQARKLMEKYPTLSRLTGELRRHGFLKK